MRTSCASGVATPPAIASSVQAVTTRSTAASTLYATWRLITTFGAGLVVIVAIGRHDDESFYKRLSQDLDMTPVGQRRDQKPSCCSHDGWPTLGPFGR